MRKRSYQEGDLQRQLELPGCTEPNSHPLTKTVLSACLHRVPDERDARQWQAFRCWVLWTRHCPECCTVIHSLKYNSPVINDMKISLPWWGGVSSAWFAFCPSKPQPSRGIQTPLSWEVITRHKGVAVRTAEKWRNTNVFTPLCTEPTPPSISPPFPCSHGPRR